MSTLDPDTLTESRINFNGGAHFIFALIEGAQRQLLLHELHEFVGNGIYIYNIYYQHL